jgi:predicted metal-dependent peptidase
MIDNKQAAEAGERLLKSRIRLLSDHGFFGLLLMHMKFIFDESCETAATDGEYIYFSPAFLSSLNDSELDFVMMHEVLHVALGHNTRGHGLDHEIFNIACDIVVNSNIMRELGRKDPIVLKNHGEAMWLTPAGREGYLYSAEDIYEELTALDAKKKKQQPQGDGKGFQDDHSYWDGTYNKVTEQAKWKKRVLDAATASRERTSNGCGTLPLFAERLLKEMTSRQVDWKTALMDFIQEEIHDYTFMPPDRRQLEGEFFLPDFNDKEEIVKDIIFYVDASGSISSAALTTVLSEISWGLEQFNGKLSGMLSYFDAKVSDPESFESISELNNIQIFGGGGTSFHAVLNHLTSYPFENPPGCCVILTDGYAAFPSEEQANGIPVLWIICNDKVTPPWGRIARIG